MRPGKLLPALAFGAALLAPPVAEADHHRSPDRGRRSGYERSDRSHGRYERGHSGRSYRRGHTRRAYRGSRHAYGRSRPVYRHRPSYRPRHPRYYRTWSRPHHVYRPLPRRYYAPWPAPYGYPGPVYGPWSRHRGGVHGSVSIGLPFIGFSLHF